MLFTSLEFLIFFPCTVLLCFLTLPQFRWIVLLAASYYFYMAVSPANGLVLSAVTLINYIGGITLDRLSAKKSRWLILTIVIGLNLMILVILRYVLFWQPGAFIRGLSMLIGTQSGLPRVLIPAGIAFYTLQALGYSIDVYRRERKAERHLGIFALYVAFFPQLICGPIERSTRLLPQFFQKLSFDYQRVSSGGRLMLLGFFKKLIIADRLAPYVQAVFSQPENAAGISACLGVYAFAFQIYYDFSAYTDIARGAGRIFGIELMENFRHPYLASSIRDFWHRWHISLSSWFRDYLYIPLGGNRVVSGRWAFNIMLVFLMSGFWHGRRMTFLAWGILHGAYYLVPALLRRWNRRDNQPLSANKYSMLKRLTGTLLTFHLVCIAWIFFRAESLTDAMTLFCNLWRLEGSAMFTGGDLPFPSAAWLLPVAAILMIEITPFLNHRYRIDNWWQHRPVWFRWCGYYTAILFVILCGAYDTPAFLYYHF